MGNWLYFDPFNGASGDMILGALIDLGLPLETLRAELAKLGAEEFEIAAERVQRSGLSGVNLRVEVAGQLPLPAHRHDQGHKRRRGRGDGDVGHSHRHQRGFPEIRGLIEASALDPEIKRRAIHIFRRLGEAEAKVHGLPLEQVHFHEVGALDSILDIVGSCIGFHFFEVERFYSAPLALGGGVVDFSHGVWPVPAPATAELVGGFPVRLGGVQAELTTPTGAAIITTLAEPGGTPPVSRLVRLGLGAGDREFEAIPNMLRLILGRREQADGLQMEGEESVALLEASIDNMDPELLGHFMELALGEGALDVHYGSLHMKKNRPGVLVSILCRDQDRERFADLVFRETTTLGVRWTPWRRWVLERESKTVESGFGPVQVKIGRRAGRVVNAWPEFEDLKRVSSASNVPLKDLRRKVMAKFEDLNYE